MIRPARKAIQRTGGWLRRVAGRRRVPAGLILLYHRIAASPADPWNLCVSPANFRAHLEVLGGYAEVVALDDLPAALGNGRRGCAYAAITFDDGYVDNLTHGVPALQRAGMPATVFLATRWIGLDTPFWWDRLAWSILVPSRIPERLDLAVSGGNLCWRGDGRFGGRRSRRRQRLALHRAAWEAVKSLDHEERDDALTRLAEWSGADPTPAEAGRAVTASEARELAGSGVVRLGAHTVNHPILPDLPPERQLVEMQDSVEACSRITGTRPSGLSYPHGRADATTIRLATEIGVQVACTGVERLVRADDDVRALPRVGVHDWAARDFERWLRWYWLP
jgi:peptidoglycan/xylan/chitin deacetylase (PgdA/CDA1 family)